MVNKLFRHRNGPVVPDGRVLVKSLTDTDEIVGFSTLKAGEQDWIPWSAAKRLATENKVKIIEYDLDFVRRAAEGRSVEDVPNLPGFFCPECLAMGKLTVWGTPLQLRGHRCSHGDLCDGRRRVPHPGARTRTDKAGIRIREKKREYMRKYRARKQGAKDVAVSEQGKQ